MFFPTKEPKITIDFLNCNSFARTLFLGSLSCFVIRFDCGQNKNLLSLSTAIMSIIYQIVLQVNSKSNDSKS